MRLRKFVSPIFINFLIIACTSSTVDIHPTLAAITMLPESTKESDPQFKSFGAGEPRSAGYWLIWNSCAENNQSETARANGGRTAGWIMMDDLLADPGILVGILKVETCQQGVNLLQIRNLQGIEMKNDVSYILAAQLLSAQLNLATGSKYCSASDQAVSKAQLLLLELNFDGIGSYLGPPRSDNKVENAQKLIEQLAQYNSGILCVP